MYVRGVKENRARVRRTSRPNCSHLRAYFPDKNKKASFSEGLQGCAGRRARGFYAALALSMS